LPMPVNYRKHLPEAGQSQIFSFSIEATVSFLKIAQPRPIYLELGVVIFYNVVQLDNIYYLGNNG
jgi:alpha-ketoglutarate-dependent taurine dioxygenase